MVFQKLNSLKLNRNHIKIWYASGMGFFTDAYDLFIIGAITATLINSYKYAGVTVEGFTPYLVGKDSLFWIGLLNSSALWSAIAGQLFFGIMGDRLGRKTIYGVEALLLTGGAIASSLSPSLPWLIISRTVMGFGIGGDYPISATIMSEYSNVKDRGKLISLIFSTQGLGALTAVAVGVLTSLYLPPWTSWRVMALVGAIPAATVIYLRRRTPETPRFSLLVSGNLFEAKRAAAVLGTELEETEVRAKSLRVGEFVSKYWKLLLGTAGTWFLLDVALYGTGIYSSPIVSSVFGSPFSHFTPQSFPYVMAQSVFMSGIPFLVGLPGYFLAVAFMDLMGRKLMQIQGFAVMAVLYLVVSQLIQSDQGKTFLTVPPLEGLIIYSLSFLFINFGPNSTTFVIPAEVYPVRFRTSGHGISAAAGKLGAALTVYLFPSLLSTVGVKNLLIMLSVVSLAGVILTLLLVKEPKGLPLEVVSGEELSVGEVKQGDREKDS